VKIVPEMKLLSGLAAFVMSSARLVCEAEKLW
jgi:hypothetical protein